MSTLHSLGFAKGEAETTLTSDFDFALVKLYL